MIQAFIPNIQGPKRFDHGDLWFVKNNIYSALLKGTENDSHWISHTSPRHI